MAILTTTMPAPTATSAATPRRRRAPKAAKALMAAHGAPLIDLWIPSTPATGRAREDARRAWQRTICIALLNWRFQRLSDARATPRLMREARRPLSAHLTIHAASGAPRSFLPVALEAVRHALHLTAAELPTTRVTVTRLPLRPVVTARGVVLANVPGVAGLRVEVWEAPAAAVTATHPMPTGDNLAELAAPSSTTTRTAHHTHSHEEVHPSCSLA